MIDDELKAEIIKLVESEDLLQAKELIDTLLHQQICETLEPK